MVANLDNMTDTFIMCNNAYFEGKLPLPNFKLIHRYTICGYFSYTENYFGEREFDAIIEFTDYYDFSDDMFVDLMCHEMIHYYLAYFEIDLNVKHGKEFRKMADRLNRKYNLCIEEDFDKSTLQRSEKAPLLQYWFSSIFGFP